MIPRLLDYPALHGSSNHNPVAKLNKTQLKKFRAHLLQYLEHLGVKIENLEDSVLRSESDASPEDGDDFGAGGGSREFQVGILENEFVPALRKEHPSRAPGSTSLCSLLP